jgi:hypothetical protein
VVADDVFGLNDQTSQPRGPGGRNGIVGVIGPMWSTSSPLEIPPVSARPRCSSTGPRSPEGSPSLPPQGMVAWSWASRKGAASGPRKLRSRSAFDAIADYLSLPEYRGCPFHNAAAEAPTGEGQRLAIGEYRSWLRQFFRQLAADTGVSDSEALAEALIVLYDGALATDGTAENARSTAMTAKRIAQLTLAAARVSSPV